MVNASTADAIAASCCGRHLHGWLLFWSLHCATTALAVVVTHLLLAMPPMVMSKALLCCLLCYHCYCHCRQLLVDCCFFVKWFLICFCGHCTLVNATTTACHRIIALCCSSCSCLAYHAAVGLYGLHLFYSLSHGLARCHCCCCCNCNHHGRKSLQLSCSCWCCCDHSCCCHLFCCWAAVLLVDFVIKTAFATGWLSFSSILQLQVLLILPSFAFNMPPLMPFATADVTFAVCCILHC